MKRTIAISSLILVCVLSLVCAISTFMLVTRGIQDSSRHEDVKYQKLDTAMVQSYYYGPRINHIKILTPTSTTSWNAGTTSTITWIKNGSTAYVDLFLMREESSVLTIGMGMLNTGSFNWTIPSPLGPSKHYQIKIQDYQNDSCSGWSSNFTINDNSTFFTSPSIGATWLAGSTHLIQWTSNISSSYTYLYLYCGESYILSIDYYYGDGGHNGSYSWSLPADLMTSNAYRVVTMYYISNYARSICYSSANFTIIGDPNQITVKNPSGYSSWSIDSTYTIEWTNFLRANDVDIYLYKGGSFVLIIDSGVVQDEYNYRDEYKTVYIYVWDIPSIAEGSNYRIKIVDSTNSSVYAFSPTFSIVRSLPIADPIVLPLIVICMIPLIIIIPIAVSRNKKRAAVQPAKPAQRAQSPGQSANAAKQVKVPSYCYNCGVALPKVQPELQYCPSCGAKQQMIKQQQS